MDGNGLPASGMAKGSRMPTMSASQALLNIKPLANDLTSLGLPSLDACLQDTSAGSKAQFGLSANRVTELYGPPGVGKTTLCIQAASDCLVAGHNVLWIDAASAIVPSRLRRFIAAKVEQKQDPALNDSHSLKVDDLMSKVRHLQVPTLAHFLALVMHSVDSLGPQDTRLVVIDSLDSLIETAYPRSIEPRAAGKRAERSSTSSRKQTLLSQISSRISSLAVMKHATVLVTNGVVTKVSGGSTAFLRPAIAGNDWEEMLHSRVVLFRDWAEDMGDQGLHCSRFARVLKAKGQVRHMQQVIADTVAFRIKDEAIEELNSVKVFAVVPTAPSNKRPHSDVEAADENSDQDYGWEEDDIHLAAEGLVNESDLARPTFASTAKAPETTTTDGQPSQEQ